MGKREGGRERVGTHAPKGNNCRALFIILFEERYKTP